MAQVEGKVLFAAIHAPLKYAGRDLLFALALDDESVFVSRHPPRVFDRQARPIPSCEISPGSLVRVNYDPPHGLTAVQVIKFAEIESPFQPVE